MAIRSFLAFELPPDIRNEVKRFSTEVKKTGLNASWVKPDNIHLTIIFMGDVDEKDIPAIISAIDPIVSQYGIFDISLGGMGLFPNIKRPRVIWLGLNGDIQGIASLKTDLGKPLESFGIKQEKRPFKPHLTLGRFRKPVIEKAFLKKIIDDYSNIPGPDGKLDELVLFKSELKPGGAVYSRIHSWPLKRNNINGQLNFPKAGRSLII